MYREKRVVIKKKETDDGIPGVKSLVCIQQHCLCRIYFEMIGSF